MKLISMTAKILEKFNEWNDDLNPDCQASGRYILGTNAYAKFLSKQLQLGDFVPTDKDGNVLTLEKCKLNCSCGEEAVKDCREDIRNQYQQALDNVIFEGFEVVKIGKFGTLLKYNDYDIILQDNQTIEDLVKYNLTITPQAIKRFNL